MTGPIGSLLRFNEYYNNTTTNHFYTAYPQFENLGGYFLNVSDKWALFQSSSSAGIVGSVSAVYRLYRGVSSTQQAHFYTTSQTQINNAVAGGYTNEGVVGYAYTSSGSNRYAVYRYYSAVDDSHWYEQRPDIAALFPNYVYKQVAWYSPTLVYGCTDSGATNYNSYANQNSGCQYFIYGCTDSLATNYDPSANQDNGTCNYPTPVISMSLSQNAIIQGGSSTLSWTIFNSTSQSISNVGSVATSGSISVSPSSTTTYTATANYYSYTTATQSVTLTVYQPVVANLTVDSTTIARGEGTVLRWDVQGDASTADIQPGIGSTNLNSFQNISPTVTTTYTLSASGLGGSDSDQVTVTVLQPPSVSISGPTNVNYTDSITISYDQTLCEEVFELQVSTVDLDNNNTSETINLGASAAANSTYTYTPTYTDRGPFRVFLTLFGRATGGLTDSDTISVGINIDQTPDAISIPESEDKIKDESPVITPDVEITTEQIVVEDIDIPVKIKADRPIQVEIDNDGIYRDVEQI